MWALSSQQFPWEMVSLGETPFGAQKDNSMAFTTFPNCFLERSFAGCDKNSFGPNVKQNPLYLFTILSQTVCCRIHATGMIWLRIMWNLTGFSGKLHISPDWSISALCLRLTFVPWLPPLATSISPSVSWYTLTCPPAKPQLCPPWRIFPFPSPPSAPTITGL